MKNVSETTDMFASVSNSAVVDSDDFGFSWLFSSYEAFYGVNA